MLFSDKQYSRMSHLVTNSMENVTRWPTITVSYDKGVPIHHVDTGGILVNVNILSM